MSFNKNLKQQGFTIVELLIVVVVIAILAAITIVSYNGITNRANQSAAKSAASTVQKKAEIYFSEKSIYPTASELTTAASSEAYALPSSAIVATVDKDNGKNSVQYEQCSTGSPAAVTGARITLWGYGATDVGAAGSVTGTRVLTLGTC